MLTSARERKEPLSGARGRSTYPLLIAGLAGAGDTPREIGKALSTFPGLRQDTSDLLSEHPCFLRGQRIGGVSGVGGGSID